MSAGRSPAPGAELDVARLADRVLTVVGEVRVAAEAAVVVTRRTEGLTRFANGAIHQHVGGEAVEVALQVADGGREAAASTTATDDAGLRRLVERALEAAELTAADGGWPGLAPATPLNGTGMWDDATADPDPALRAEQVRRFVDAGPGLLAAGYCDSAGTEAAFANSAGQRVRSRATQATIEGIHRSPTAAGGAHATSASLSALDGAALGSRSATTARAGADPIEIEPGDYEVVLDARCVAEVVEFLAWYGFNGRASAEGQSFVRLGAPQLDPQISLWDDALDPRSVGLPFDAEGTPKRRLDLVRAGTCVGLAHDRRTARAAGGGASSTGHAIAGGASFGAIPANVFLGGGDRTVEQLVGSMERGLLVSELNYCRILDPKTQVVTGLTRNGTFLVEHGQVVGPVATLRFTQSCRDALGPGAVLGVGDDDRLIGSTHVPSLHLARWRFTGGGAG